MGEIENNYGRKSRTGFAVFLVCLIVNILWGSVIPQSPSSADPSTGQKAETLLRNIVSLGQIGGYIAGYWFLLLERRFSFLALLLLAAPLAALVLGPVVALLVAFGWYAFLPFAVALWRRPARNRRDVIGRRVEEGEDAGGGQEGE